VEHEDRTVSNARLRIVTSPEPPALPPAFDWSIYVARNPDLAGFGEADAASHYASYGREEGRVCSAIDGRGAFLGLIPPSESLLEIGPFCTPCFTTQTHRVRFLDAFPTEELRKIVAELSWGRPELVPEIDYVWRGGPYAELIAERFDAVFSSHNIEHQPCLVTHLNDIASVLAPGRWLFLIVPDRRYCFDHYLPESTIADVLDALIEGRRRHSARSILEHRMMLTHNEAEPHWQGDHGPDPRRRAPDADILRRIAENLKTLPGRDTYIDAHAWQFVPDSFAHLIGTLNAAGLTPFTVERIYPTLRSTHEFFAVLRLQAVPSESAV
jgi:hypothetical protein